MNHFHKATGLYRAQASFHLGVFKTEAEAVACERFFKTDILPKIKPLLEPAPKHHKPKSGYRGCFFNEKRKAYQVICRKKYLGLFKDPTVAAKVYDAEAAKHGLKLNFPCPVPSESPTSPSSQTPTALTPPTT